MRSIMLAGAELMRPGPVVTSGGGEGHIQRVTSVNVRHIQGSCKGATVAISISGKEWRIPPEVSVDDTFLAAANGSGLLAKMLLRRGIRTPAEAEVFLDPQNFEPSGPNELPDMPKAVARIMTAIAHQEQITVYGDYDVDGVTGTSVLITVLRKLGAKVDYYIPNRMTEGYGLNLKAVSIIASKRKTKLIISCDCGVSNFAEINFAKSLGVETIIADHHTMPALMPPAVAILHPKLLDESHPLYHLPGVGVAYKLCEALLIENGRPEEAASLLDYVTLGMIADLVPLIRENRYLVQIGLPLLSASPRPGIKALLAQVTNNGSTDVVGFGLAPRINAVGRLADANQAVELLTTEDQEAAEKIAKQLQLENARRQELCEQIMLEADHLVATTIDTTKEKAIVICKEGWHHGVVGIVASRLVEKYHCPAFVGAIDLEENIVKGSARGVPGIDLYEALKANEHLMTRWGGHKMAAGFSLEVDKVKVFSRALTDTCNRMLAEKSLRPILEVDAVVGAEEVDVSLVNLLAAIAPFGMDNKKPILVLKDVYCSGTRALGKEGKHTRVMLEELNTGETFESVFWNSKDKVPADGARLDVAFTPEINSYNGRDRLQLVLADWRCADGSTPKTVSEELTTVLPAQEPTIAVPAQEPTVAVVTHEPVVVGGESVSTAQPGSAPELASVSAVQAGSAGILPASQTLTNNHKPVYADEAGEAEEVDEDMLEGDGTATVEHDRLSSLSSVTLTWKDLRGHADPKVVLKAAVKNLGDKLSIYSESPEKLDGVSFRDRTAIPKAAHLLLWQFPPSAKVLQDLLVSSGAKTIYLVGGAPENPQDAAGFLRKLIGLARFAVNQREGQVTGDKLAAALSADKMAVALGLAILKRVGVLDWFVEDGIIFIDLLDHPIGTPEQLPEYRQLTNTLAALAAFRKWFSEASPEDIQLEVLQNRVQVRKPQQQELKDESHEPSHTAEVR
jgi:single-stranded-DNA-specific exonuclease RecJ